MSRGKFYLDKSNGKLMGVCAGIADYTEIDVLWVRLAAVLMLVFGSPIIIPIYLAFAFLAEKRPMGLYTEEEEMRLLRRMERNRQRRRNLPITMPSSSRSSHLQSDLSDIDRRIREMEAHYTTSNSSRLAAEIDSLR
ncbi:phage shock protein C [Novosphingobium sp. Rr 2-17]|uniref:PspC domain-containing protein n=1 Tax=Novosphingobium sp. Rr 2-17 TaxID=555793 RepID=UPI0002697F12|nr:PspC domain-containing protein [Novosphingobium sp. Rr 2-17]EIZ77127.1 phage shock protein C [Novosphingobium sp. Rr 2-17]